MLKKWEKIVLLQDWQNSGCKDLDVHGRIRVVAHFSSGIAELARVKITPREKGVSLFSRGVIFTRARSTISEDKWGTTWSLCSWEPTNDQIASRNGNRHKSLWISGTGSKTLTWPKGSGNVSKSARWWLFILARVDRSGFHVSIVVNIQRVQKMALCLLIIALSVARSPFLSWSIDHSTLVTNLWLAVIK